MVSQSFTLDPDSKAWQALHMISNIPQFWFPVDGLDDRDKALLSAAPVPFLNYNKGSFLRKIYRIDPNGGFGRIEWTVENDKECRGMILDAGAVSHTDSTTPAIATYRYASLIVNVEIGGAPNSGFDWGFLSTKASSVRIFRGPPATCTLHPWDAMILRDCKTNTDSLQVVEAVAAHRWDLLVMKMCEDFDFPWVVVAAKCAGSAPPPQQCCLP